MVGWNSAIWMPAASKGPHCSREAARTTVESMILPGVMIWTETPRFLAAIRALMVSSSGTKYALDRRIECFAAVIAIRYIRCIDSLPPVGELLNIWAGWVPVAARGGK